MKKIILGVLILFLLIVGWGVLILFLLLAGCSQTPPPQPAPQVNQQSTWATYVNQADGIQISHPADWVVIITTVPKIKTESTSITMSDLIHIYTPDSSGVVQIGGFSVPTLLYSSGKIISEEELYEVMVDSFHNGSSVTSVTTDNTSYMINGNPVRHLQLTLNKNKLLTSDIYIVKHNDIYYTLSYLSYDPSAQQYAATATEIMKTLKTVSWETQ